MPIVTSLEKLSLVHNTFIKDSVTEQSHRQSTTKLSKEVITRENLHSHFSQKKSVYEELKPTSGNLKSSLNNIPS